VQEGRGAHLVLWNFGLAGDLGAAFRLRAEYGAPYVRPPRSTLAIRPQRAPWLAPGLA
jgi:hypothetical protein